MIRRLKSQLLIGLLWVLLLCPSQSPALPGGGTDSGAAPKEAIKSFLEEELVFDRYVFPPGQFPGVHWKRPDVVERLVGSFPLTCEFYDSSSAHVVTAVAPGRYGAVVRGTTPGGFLLVRYVTLYCSAVRFDDYAPDVPVALQPLPGYGIPADAWKKYSKNLRRFSFGSLLLFPEHDPDAAIFLAGLSELKANAPPDETPRLIDRRWWMDFKRLHDGQTHPLISIAPTTLDRPAATLANGGKLQDGTLTSADLKDLRKVCALWTDSSGVPMTALIVHRGKVVFHESFGKTREGSAMWPARPTWMASITKCLTGVLVMQFVDRGLVGLDVPIDRYLPELSAPCRLTLRLLLTHSSGLSWAGEWASDWNPSMENQVAQALPFLAPGREFAYTRAGYALTSKILERISGETVPRLFERMLFTPLGMTSSFSDNTYGGLYAPALDVATFGEMLRNKGRYGKYEILSEKAWRAFLPAPLPLTEGTSEQRWGIGTSPFVRDGLSSEAFGHSAASGAIFRIDPLRELVIVVGRDRTGPDEKLDRRCASRFVRTLTTALDRSTGHE
jgi:CubicO group peptidase (beta-lactamase class C family)